MRWAAFRNGFVAKRWARRAFDEFEVSSGRREEMLASIVVDALHLTRLANDLGAHRDGSRRRFVEFLLQACQRVDSGDVRHTSARFRSYVDVSVQAKALRAFADCVSSRCAFAGDPVNVTALLLEERPDSRPGLLAHAELLDILRSPVMRHPALDMDMLMPLLPEVVASDVRIPLLHVASRRVANELRWGLSEA